MIFLNSPCVFAESVVLPPVIDNSNYSATGGSSFGAAKPSTNAMYEVLGRLEQLQLEVQQLRGVVDQQSQTIIDLKKRQGNIYSDLDLRIQELSGVSAQGNTSLAATHQQGFQKVKPTMSQPLVSHEKELVKYDSVSTTAKDVVVDNNQKQRYTAAYETLRNGHNSLAISAFKALLTEFPKGEYADNSQYWLGEAYKVNLDLNAAKAAFSKVVRIYPNSPKVPDALLKLGYIEFEANNMAKARDYLTQVRVSYPGTTAAHLAAKKLIKMGEMYP